MGSTLPQIKPGSIYDCVVARANTTPDAVVFAAPGRRPLTYGGLLRQTHAVRDMLTSMGLGRNSRVAIAIDNGPEVAVAFIAMASCLTCIPLNPNYRADEFEFYLSRMNAKALIVDAKSNSPAKAIAETLRLSIIELSSEPGTEAGLFKLDGGNNVAPVRGGFAQPDDVALLLHTSGTTSLPKIVPITHANICAQAANNQVFLNLTADDLCLNVMPLYHSTGLIGVVLSSVMSGGGVVCTPGFYAPHFPDWVAEFEPTWFTAVPSMHQAILARAANDKERVEHNRLRFIRSSSAALPRHTLQELENVFKTSVIESYGLTECGMIACNPLAFADRKIGSVGVPTHVELGVMDESGAFLSSPDKGEIVVRGECVVDGYEDEEVNEQSFTDGWFRTGDLGFLDSDGYLFITGRRKEIINRGGEKISPLEVDQTFMDHVAVEQAVTFPVPNEVLGEELATAVLLRPQFSVTEDQLREFVSQKLADFKVPRQILIVSEIPKGAFGKIQRRRLANQLKVQPLDQLPQKIEVPYAPPRTPEESMLVEIWGRVLGQKVVGIHDDFFRLGGDSVLATQVVSQVRNVMQIELSPASLFATPTVAELAQSLTARQKVAAIPPITSLPRD